MTRRRAAVLGHPIQHSLSPAVHRAAYQALDLDWDYTAVDVTESGLSDFLAGLGPEWVGLSLTMPLKRAVIPLLDDVEDVAATVGAVNTVVFEHGRRRGYNTDVPGLVAALHEHGPVRTDEASILGAGATAASALAAIAEVGVRQIQAFTRRPQAGADLVALADRLGTRLTVAAWSDAAQAMVSGLVVSTVPAGVTDQLVHAVPTLPGTLLDVVYDPWPTALAAQWAVRGGRVLSGHDLLVQQAAIQVRLMTGRQVDLQVLRDALPVS